MKQNTLQFQLEMITNELNSQVDNYYNVYPPYSFEDTRKPIIGKIRKLQEALNERIDLICQEDNSFLTVV